MCVSVATKSATLASTSFMCQKQGATGFFVMFSRFLSCENALFKFILPWQPSVILALIACKFIGYLLV